MSASYTSSRTSVTSQSSPIVGMSSTTMRSSDHLGLLVLSTVAVFFTRRPLSTTHTNGSERPMRSALRRPSPRRIVTSTCTLGSVLAVSCSSTCISYARRSSSTSFVQWTFTLM